MQVLTGSVVIINNVLFNWRSKIFHLFKFTHPIIATWSFLVTSLGKLFKSYTCIWFSVHVLACNYVTHDQKIRSNKIKNRNDFLFQQRKNNCRVYKLATAACSDIGMRIWLMIWTTPFVALRSLVTTRAPSTLAEAPANNSRNSKSVVMIVVLFLLESHWLCN